MATIEEGARECAFLLIMKKVRKLSKRHLTILFLLIFALFIEYVCS